MGTADFILLDVIEAGRKIKRKVYRFRGIEVGT